MKKKKEYRKGVVALLPLHPSPLALPPSRYPLLLF